MEWSLSPESSHSPLYQKSQLPAIWWFHTLSAHGVLIPPLFNNKYMEFRLKNKLLFFFPAFIFSTAAWAGEITDDWVHITSTTNMEWLGKKNSGEIGNFDNKKNNSYFYIMQTKEGNRYKYAKVFVELTSCSKGYGYVYYNNMEGEFTGKDQFIRFGETVADALGSMACTSWDSLTGKKSLVANNEAWENVAEAVESGDKYFIRNDMVRKTKYNNKPVVSAIYRYDMVKSNKKIYGEFIFELASCKRGYGVVYDLSFDGKVTEKYDVALNGNSVLSGAISKVCGKI
ncbi:hypothetical protein GTP23_02545 [Pseudoduganella sp. FT93W]|uniref:Uncharacterized protein n=1 Tax=Duganella fentianensis TaxID=2692177 RepID=A0A845HWJ5_9BURK|nr:hypothetical protein [Duganella fentianensis]MYN43945.1 hypothetical protein [Duganella fentianensis]